ncbi:MAG: hypothetical protein ABJL72_06450 [Roseobacter sp.]
MSKYQLTPRGVVYDVTKKKKSAWEKFTDAIAVFGLGVIGFVVICLIAAATGG